jgi:hypothetical protein
MIAALRCINEIQYNQLYGKAHISLMMITKINSKKLAPYLHVF